MFGFGEEAQSIQQQPEKSWGDRLWDFAKIAGIAILAVFTLGALHDGTRDKLNKWFPDSSGTGTGLGTKIRNLTESTTQAVGDAASKATAAIQRAVTGGGGVDNGGAGGSGGDSNTTDQDQNKNKETKKDSGITTWDVAKGTGELTSTALVARTAYKFGSKRFGDGAPGVLAENGEFQKLSYRETTAYHKRVKAESKIAELEEKIAKQVKKDAPQRAFAEKEIERFKVEIEDAEKPYIKAKKALDKETGAKIVGLFTDTRRDVKEYNTAKERFETAQANLAKAENTIAGFDKKIKGYKKDIEGFKEDIRKLNGSLPEGVMTRGQYKQTDEGKRYYQSKYGSEVDNITHTKTSDSKSVVKHVMQQGGTRETSKGVVEVIGQDGKVVGTVGHDGKVIPQQPSASSGQHTSGGTTAAGTGTPSPTNTGTGAPPPAAGGTTTPAQTSGGKPSVIEIDDPHQGKILVEKTGELGKNAGEYGDMSHAINQDGTAKPATTSKSPIELLEEKKPNFFKRAFRALKKPFAAAAGGYALYETYNGSSEALAAVNKENYGQAAKGALDLLAPLPAQVLAEAMQPGANYIGDAAKQAFSERELSMRSTEDQNKINEWEQRARELGFNIPRAKIMEALKEYDATQLGQPLNIPQKPRAPEKGQGVKD